MSAVVQSCRYRHQYCVNGVLAQEGLLPRKGIAAHRWLEWVGMAEINVAQVKRGMKCAPAT